MHANAVIRPYHFIDEMAKGVENYHMLDIYVWSAGLWFPYNVCFTRIELLIVIQALSVLFWMKRFQIGGLEYIYHLGGQQEHIS